VHAYLVAIVAGAFAVYALASRRLRSSPVTGPILFVAFGLLIGTSGLGLLHPSDDPHLFTLTFETTLVLVLFTDAMAVNTGSWRTEIGLPTRLLGIGLPLTIAVGWGLAALLFGKLDIWEAALVGTILAPTDAALGLAVVSNPRVPELIRQGLNVESGLNDGIALPFLTVFLAFADHAGGGDPFVVVFLKALVLAAALGVVIGWGGAKVVLWAARRGWIGPHWQQIFVLAIAALTYAIATPLGASGFIAAWAGGCAMGVCLRDQLPGIRELPENLASLLTTVSFLFFGAIYLGPALAAMTWPVALYAALSLTLVRMAPVAAASVGTGLSPPTIGYLGWFGPRGLASIVFADLIVEHALPGTSLITTIVNVTVGMSVLAHGATSWIGSERYAAWYETRVRADPNLPEAGRVEHLAARRRNQEVA
jgi:sodium/hydrogen antiporter